MGSFNVEEEGDGRKRGEMEEEEKNLGFLWPCPPLPKRLHLHLPSKMQETPAREDDLS
nr:unnamed protein product [Digitaria exilis]